MNVKLYFLTFVAALATVSCVDSDYDLANVSTDDIVIGDDDSVFEIPVATITLTPDNLNGASAGSSLASSNSSSFDEIATRSSTDESTFSNILKLVNAFLPSGESVDIALLTDDATSEAEVTRLVTILVEELLVNNTKCLDLAEALYDYTDDLDDKEEVSSLFTYLGLTGDPDDMTVEEIYNALIGLREYSDSEIVEFEALVVDVILANMVLELQFYVDLEVEEAIDPFSISSDIADLISSNTSSSASTLSIVITYEHNFPFTFNFNELKLINSSANPSEMTFSVTAQGEDTIPTEVDFDEFTSILEGGDGATIYTSLNLDEYLSNDNSGDYWLKIKISVVKTGSISF